MKIKNERIGELVRGGKTIYYAVLSDGYVYENDYRPAVGFAVQRDEANVARNAAVQS